jgi:hypothetical protein
MGLVPIMRMPMNRKLLVGCFLLMLGLALLPSRTVRAQAGFHGEWTTLASLMPINPIHVALMHTGKVLIVAGSGNLSTETQFRAAVWDPQTDTIAAKSYTWDMFCNGMVVLPDGRVFVNGGNLQYDPFQGEPRNAAFDPVSETFTDLESMAHGRWYPTPTVLGDGRVMTFSGLLETGGTNTAVEIYTVGSGWSPEYPAGWTPPLYPRMHLLPNGNVFYSGSGRGSRIFNPATRTWSAVVATTNYGSTRTYGTSVLLPLTPENGYRPRVMILGGGNPGTETTEIIDLAVGSPSWQYGPPMSQPRIELNATLLPSGKVLVVGGSKNDEDAATASLNADLYDPVTNTFSSAGANAFPRLYHSNALLLPDATVLVNGGNPQRGNYEQRQEIYSPAYLFNADGSRAARPGISAVSSDAVRYGLTFQVSTPDAADIGSVVLLRPGSPTHAFDQEQRFVGLSYTAGSGVLNVTAPPDGNIAPPGYYMLFILNSAGVPSLARFVHLSSANQPPTASIDSPAADVTINPGQAVSFSGSGTDPDGTVAGYSWTFPGGNPASSSVAAPGSVTYAAPGNFVASLAVTDNEGRASETATRTITVPDFALSASPSSRSVSQGGDASYTATVTGGSGFTGTVAMSVSGLPPGAIASFDPAAVTGSGSTTLRVSTGSSTPAGSYVLTIAGTIGTLKRTAQVALVVTADFTLSVTPSSRTISRGGSTTYTVTVAAGQGFSGTIRLTVADLPRFVNARFKPDQLSGSGTSTLSITTNKNIAVGTSSLTINGTSGGVVRSAVATLVVQ